MQEKNSRLWPEGLYVVGFLSLLVYGLDFFLFNRYTTFHTALHDTYFVFAYFQLLIFMGIVFGFFVVISFGISKWLHRRLIRVLVWLHCGSTMLGMSIFFWAQEYGEAGRPRRYTNHLSWQSFLRQDEYSQEFVSSIALIVVAAQLLFVFNVVYTICRPAAESIYFQNKFRCARCLCYAGPVFCLDSRVAGKRH